MYGLQLNVTLYWLYIDINIIITLIPPNVLYKIYSKWNDIWNVLGMKLATCLLLCIKSLVLNEKTNHPLKWRKRDSVSSLFELWFSWEIVKTVAWMLPNSCLMLCMVGSSSENKLFSPSDDAMLDFLAVPVFSLTDPQLPLLCFSRNLFKQESLVALSFGWKTSFVYIFMGKEGHCWLKKKACGLGHMRMPHARQDHAC